VLEILSDTEFIGPRQTRAEQHRLAGIAKEVERAERCRLAEESLLKSGEMPGLAAAYKDHRRSALDRVAKLKEGRI
jgi:hypothetical protein